MMWRKYVFMMIKMRRKMDIRIGLSENYLPRQGRQRKKSSTLLQEAIKIRHAVGIIGIKTQ